MSPREHKQIIGVLRLDHDRVVVEYSNNSSAVYTVDQLQSLTPVQVGTEEDDEDDVADEYEKNVLQFPQRHVG
jgi:hypothetical protein